MFSIGSVVLSLLTLVIYCGQNIEISLQRNYSIWLETLLMSNIITAEGFNIEMFILLGLIFDLYKWWLFIASTKEYNEEIKDR